jgi:type I restriction enzyme, S subunit
MLFPGDIYASLKGATKDGKMIGSVARVPPSVPTGRLTQDTVKLVFRNPNAEDASYLHWVLRTPQYRDYCAGHAMGSAVVALSRRDFLEYPVPPPTVERRTVVALLDAIEERIEINRQTSETLEAMARAIFKDWFVDFGPTRARMEARSPYLAPETWALFPDRLDQEGKPEGWAKEPLLNHARLISGGTPKTEKPAYWDGTIAWASAKDVSQCGDAFLIMTERTITERGLSESATRIIPKLSTVVVARGATTGRYCMFGRDMAMNQTCYALTSPSGRAYWLYCTFGSLVEGLVHAAHGSVFDTITTKTIEGARAMIATGKLLDQFEAMIAPFFARILSNIENSDTLAAVRDLLLPKLMSGQIRVKDAGKVAEAAL